MLPFRRAIRNRSLLVFTVQQYMNAGADYVYQAIMASYFLEARGVTDKFILGLLASLPLWGGALGGVAGGFINDFLDRSNGKPASLSLDRRFLGQGDRLPVPLPGDHSFGSADRRLAAVCHKVL